MTITSRYVYWARKHELDADPDTRHLAREILRTHYQGRP